MCGRYTDSRRKKELMVRFGFQADLAFTPRYNIVPTQEASIVALGEEGGRSTSWPAGVCCRCAPELKTHVSRSFRRFVGCDN